MIGRNGVARPRLVGGGKVGLMGRRGFLGAATGALLIGGPTLATRAEAVPRDLTFRVYRDGTDIGRHALSFAPAADGFSVESHVELEVKIAFITAFRYEQRGRDVWVGDHLVASDIVTDDDGERTTLRARIEDGALYVEGAAGKVTAPIGTMNDLSFWNAAIIAARQLIDSQTGQLGPLRASGGVGERIAVRGQEIAAVSYAIESSNGRAGRIWYDQSGNWVKARLSTRGETLDYELA
jgi:hypothetical protein